MRNTRRRSGESGSQGFSLCLDVQSIVLALLIVFFFFFFLIVAEKGQTSPESQEVVDAPVTTSETKKSSKKRKLDNSPPWKSATTQTPTAFIIDGRRKSGRTNPLPVEFLPIKNATTPTRGTRVSQRQAGQQTNDVSAARSAPRASAKASSSKQLANGKSPTRSSSRNTKTPTKSTSSAGANNITSPSSKRSAAPPSSSRPRVSSKTTPSRAHSSKPKPSPAIGTRKSARALKKAVAAAEEELAGSKRGLSDSCANGFSDGDYSFDSEGELELSPNFKVPKVKVKLKFGIPKPIITHPSQIPPPKPFATFEEFLQQDDPSFDEAQRLGAEESAREEAELRNRIEYEARFGLLTRENCSLFVPDKQPEPERQYGHQDHLIAHALHFRKLMLKERKEHQELMRKRNAALMAEVRSRMPRTQEEIEQEQCMENWKLFKEQISQLRRKWEEVAKVSDPQY